jgi:D-glycero-D-manno-heptose 1,7-bisphosphate phosphatase
VKLSPALFLDRDGVINIDHAYIFESKNFTFIEGIFDLCRIAKTYGYLLFVVTNQSGIARGYYSEQDFLQLTEWMLQAFKSQQVFIDKVYFCPFHPLHGIGNYQRDSNCRKPNPGMILQAASEFAVDLAKSVLIGDKLTDIQAGKSAGIGCNLLYDPDSTIENNAETTVIQELMQAGNFLKNYNTTKIPLC